MGNKKVHIRFKHHFCIWDVPDQSNHFPKNWNVIVALQYILLHLRFNSTMLLCMTHIYSKCFFNRMEQLLTVL